MRAGILCFIRRLLVMVIFAIPNMSAAGNILELSGANISENFSFEDLLAMPQTKVVTKNDYIDEAVEFTGPKLKDILVRYNIGPKETITFRALNDFQVSIPASDAYKYDVILALLSNGKRMPVRDKGPIWVIYPMDDHPELHLDTYYNRLAWQLKSITVE